MEGEVFEVHGTGLHNYGVILREGTGQIYIRITNGVSATGIDISPSDASYLATRLRRLAGRAERRI